MSVLESALRETVEVGLGLGLGVGVGSAAGSPSVPPARESPREWVAGRGSGVWLLPVGAAFDGTDGDDVVGVDCVWELT